MVAEIDLLQIEVALRDSRHTDVIMALDRLVLLPQSREELHQSKTDLMVVKLFFEKHLPKQHMDAAVAVFREHGSFIMAAQNNKEK